MTARDFYLLSVAFGGFVVVPVLVVWGVMLLGGGRSRGTRHPGSRPGRQARRAPERSRQQPGYTDSRFTTAPIGAMR